MPHEVDRSQVQYPQMQQWSGMINPHKVALLDAHQRKVLKQSLEAAFPHESQLSASATYQILLQAGPPPHSASSTDHYTVQLINMHPDPLVRKQLQCLFNAVSIGVYASLPEYETLSMVVPSIGARYFSPEELLRATQIRAGVSVNPYIQRMSYHYMGHPRLPKTYQGLIQYLVLCNTYTNTLFSVDIEAYELDHSLVTEIGISIADPALAIDNREQSLRNIHIVIDENKHLYNGRHVEDNRDNYLFGQSIVLPQQEARSVVQALVNYYFCERQVCGMGAVFVSHGTAGDIKWLKKIGVQLPAQMKCVDTQKLFSCTHGTQMSSLGNILKGFDIPHAFLHNGGNDATFTLILLLRMTDPQFRVINGIDHPNASQVFQNAVKTHRGYHYDYPSGVVGAVRPATWRTALQYIYSS